MGNNVSGTTGFDGQDLSRGTSDGSISSQHLRSPFMRNNVPVVPFHRAAEMSHKQLEPTQKGIPTLITWNFGGNEVIVQGSWDGWSSRRPLHKSGKDNTILLVLPCGVYCYNFIIDGDHKHIHDLPCISDERGHTWNVLDVKETVPEILESVKEFEGPPSPMSSYSNPYPDDDDFTKDPPLLPPQLHITSIGPEKGEDERPRHVMLDHLFIQGGWAPHQVLSLGLTQRYRDKYVTLVLYKPLNK